ncbi:ATP-binding protein [Paraburkholderia sp. J11-2]|uniref:ATP-binding protein n=1 Tax=Paraburkholderia sp. J11-2 TaxID=2805431 RepID=UPI002AB7741F|nr:ATP-binding protein [Paraburkholderia sp. J11-2]
MNSSSANPYAVEARYAEQHIPQYRDRPLIAALPPIPSDEELAEDLFDFPSFSVDQRGWPASDRLCMVAELASFLCPLQRHIRLTRAFDTLIRSGYARRGIRSTEHIQTYQRLYEAKQQGRAIKSNSVRVVDAQLSSALIGIPGSGKTTAVRRIFARYPEAIYHPDYNIIQIPYLHIECPHDGISVKGLALSILRKLDLLVPDSNYIGLYRASNSAEVLLNHVARAMHNHYVGVLVVDEIQNLKNAGRTNASLMAALVTAANELNVPIVFVGTNRAEHVLGIDCSSARRSSAAGFPSWGALETSHNIDTPDEWEDFFTALWTFQWIRKPVPLDAEMSNCIYELTQGIPDVAIKLFACAQWRGILDGTESFGVETLYAIMANELRRLEPMLDAIRSGDIEALSRYEDITPLGMKSLLHDAQNAYEGVRQRGAAIRTDSSSFIPRVTSVLVEAGIDSERAHSMAQKVADEGKAVGVVEGASAALQLAKPPRPVRRRQIKAERPASVELAPDDYRNSISRAREAGTSNLQQLVGMGAARPLHELLEYV